MSDEAEKILRSSYIKALEAKNKAWNKAAKAVGNSRRFMSESDMQETSLDALALLEANQHLDNMLHNAVNPVVGLEDKQ